MRSEKGGWSRSVGQLRGRRRDGWCQEQCHATVELPAATLSRHCVQVLSSYDGITDVDPADGLTSVETDAWIR